MLVIAFLGFCGLMFWQLSLLKSTVNESAGNELLPAFTVMAALTALVLAGVGLVVAGLRKSSQQAQRLAEETAQTSELILNSAAEGIFCVDRNGRITMANPAAAKMTRWGLPELIGEDAGALLGKDGLQSLRCPEEESSRAVTVQETSPGSLTQSVFQRKDGTSFHVESRCAPMPGQLGGGIVVTFRDITDRMRVERERDRFLDLSLDMFCVAGLDGLFKHVNPAFERVL